MRTFFGLLVLLVVSVGAAGVGHARNVVEETASQASPAHVPKCIIPPTADCNISKGKIEFIRWQAPPNEDLYVCFIGPSPFTKQKFHIRAGHHEDTVLKLPPPANGSFQFSTGNQPCARTSDKDRATARVIIED